jgi:hypothetical protein
LNGPETDSDGIHDTLVTDDSKRMSPPALRQALPDVRQPTTQ